MGFAGRLAFLGVVFPLVAQGPRASWSFEFQGGSAWSLPGPLVIEREGRSGWSLRAHWSTRPFEGSPYYAWRIGRWSRDRAWELELIHHKLYLNHPPAGIGHLEISHGFNLITVNRAWAEGPWRARAGLGLLVTHAEGTLEGAALLSDRGPIGGGYVPAGPALQGALQRTWPLGHGFFLSAEGKVTWAYGRIPFEGGQLRVGNLALHALLGAGHRW